MKKIFKFLLWLLAIIVVLLVVIYMTAGIWLKSAVSTLVPQMTKTSASLQQADVSLFSGKLTFKGLKIGNPDGFTAPNAFELGEISVNFEPTSLLTSKIIINEIKIDGTKIDAELARTGNMNLIVLSNNIQEYFGNPTPTNTYTNQTQLQKSASQKQASSKAILVKDLKITNSSLDFTFLTQKKQVKLPNIHEKNIGQKQKETLADIVAGIFDKLSASSINQISKASQESVNQLLDNLADRSKEASGLVNQLKTEMKNMF